MLKCIMYYYARKADYVLIDEKKTDGIPENDIQNAEPINNPEIIEDESHDLFGEALSDEAFPGDSDETAEASVENTEENTAEKGAEAETSRDTESPESSRPQDGDEKSVSENTAKKEPEVKQRGIDSLFDFIELFIFTLAAVFIITSFFFRYSIVEGDSMVGTLHEGDRLILRSFMYDPEPGDIIVLNSDVLDKVIVKRVIAVGGQTVRITKTDVYVDGKKLNEPYVYKSYYGYEYAVPEDPGYIEVPVPEGHVYVMGDHRNISEDSRGIGTVDENAIIGKVVFRFAPFDQFGYVK